MFVEAEYSESEVAEMTNTELLDHWLEYNGICGYTEDTKEVIEAAFDVDFGGLAMYKENIELTDMGAMMCFISPATRSDAATTSRTIRLL